MEIHIKQSHQKWTFGKIISITVSQSKYLLKGNRSFFTFFHGPQFKNPCCNLLCPFQPLFVHTTWCLIFYCLQNSIIDFQVLVAFLKLMISILLGHNHHISWPSEYCVRFPILIKIGSKNSVFRASCLFNDVRE
jgi:hypothetical protein